LVYLCKFVSLPLKFSNVGALNPREIFQSALNESEGVINVRKYKPEAAKTVKVELESFPDPLPVSVAESTGSLNEEIGAALREILAIIKETIQARTVAFCWVNRAKKRLIVSAVQTDAPDFTAEKSLPFQSDAVTQIVIARKAQLYTEISASDEPTLITYYSAPNGIKAFMGVPIFYHDDILAVLFADSLAKGAFGHDDVHLLSRFGKLCSAFIEKYDLKSSYIETLRFAESAQQLTRYLYRTLDLNSILNHFCESISQAIEFDHLVLALLNRKAELVVKKSISKSQYIAEGSIIDLERSAVGHAVTNGNYGAIDDLSQLGGVPRFYVGETLQPNANSSAEGTSHALPKQGSMLILPIRLGELTAGVLTLEHEQPRYFNTEIFKKARFFVETLALALHRLLLDDQRRTMTPIDEETGTLSLRTFYARLSADINRCLRHQQDLALILVEFDAQEALKNRYSATALTMMMRQAAGLIMANTRSYDLVARFGDFSYAICLTGISETHVRFWAEKIREQILNFAFETEDKYKSIIATVSIGIARLRESQPDIETLVSGAQKALEHAKLSGGNVVKIF
jgi:diguanylate cyclase (GGDEF)-like protein